MPYYQRFMDALPDVAALAAAPEEVLLKLWEGLGYYSRVRNLQKAAQVVMSDFGGKIPPDFAALLSLPGIGPYTAGAIASIAFGLPEVAVDGNVLRVFARLMAHDGDVMKPAAKKVLSAEVRRQMPENAPGDYNQALMELGALVCLPGTPDCPACPLSSQCAAKAQGCQQSLPVRAKAPPKAVLPMTGFVVFCGGQVLLQQRPAKGLLAGMWQPPLVEGRLTQQQAQAYLETFMPGARLVEALPSVRHVFTHRVWELEGWLCAIQAQASPVGQGLVFATPAQLAGQYALPGAFKGWLPLMKAGGPSDEMSFPAAK